MEHKYVNTTIVDGVEKNTFGAHLVADFWGVSAELLNSPDRIIEILKDGAVAGYATVIDSCIHQFSPYGVTATVTLSESHIAFHSWPEVGYCAIDVFVCGKADSNKVLEYIAEKFQPERKQVCSLMRGDLPRLS